MRPELRAGWCPGVLRPMAAADGLIVRLRLTGGRLTAAIAIALADLAARHGNGRFDLSTRANLQMRGVATAALPALVEALRELKLVDADADAEAVRNVVASPMAGLHDGVDIRPLVGALETRLATTPDLRRLPHKFGFLIDDGSAPSLDDVPADVRFDWLPEIGVFAIGLGGTRAGAVPAGQCAAEALVDRAATIAHGAIAGFAQVPEARRLHALVVALSPDEVLAICKGAARAPQAAARQDSVCDGPKRGRPGPSPRAVPAVAVLELAAPYGRLDASMLRVAGALALDGLGELRLTPWRTMLLPGVEGAHAQERAGRAGWIAGDSDPRLAVAACVGAPECARATTPTRRDADALAELAAAFHGRGTTLHVSGCAKSCAHAGVAPMTLVGRDGRYDLVRDGRAGDAPLQRGLDLAEARSALGELLAHG